MQCMMHAVCAGSFGAAFAECLQPFIYLCAVLLFRDVPDWTFAGFQIPDFVLVSAVKCHVMQRALFNMLMSPLLVYDV